MATHQHRWYLNRLQSVVVRSWRYTQRWWWSQQCDIFWSEWFRVVGGTLRDNDNSNIEVIIVWIKKSTFDTVIERGWRTTWRTRLCKLGSLNWVRLLIPVGTEFNQVRRPGLSILGTHLEAISEQVHRYSLKTRCTKSGDALGEGNLVSSNIHLEVVTKQTWRPWLR